MKVARVTLNIVGYPTWWSRGQRSRRLAVWDPPVDLCTRSLMID